MLSDDAYLRNGSDRLAHLTDAIARGPHRKRPEPRSEPRIRRTRRPKAPEPAPEHGPYWHDPEFRAFCRRLIAAWDARDMEARHGRTP